MSLNIKLKRSAVAGSAPTAAQLEDGELAVNYNDTDPALYIKDSTGAVVRIAGEGAVGGDLQLVTDTGNTTTNDVLIGGTLPNLPNITLNATDGSAIFAGNVGIGTTPATNRDRLDVQVGNTGGFGRIKLADNSGVSATIEALRSSTDTATVLAFEATTDDGNCFNVNYGGGAYFKGNVGIGTDNPQAKLDVDGDAVINTLTVGLGGGSVATNTAVGVNALSSNTTGIENTAVGRSALLNNTEGDYNTAVGRNTLYNNTADANTALGRSALFSNTIGTNNTAVGLNALAANITGNENTAIGSNALYTNGEGDYNTAIGRNSLYTNTTGSDNTAVGRNSLYTNTTGAQNTALGRNSLFNNTEGNSNTAVGLSAVFTNTTGAANTAIGQSALYNNTIGNNNAAVGLQTLYFNTEGSSNTAVGLSALYTNTEGSSNTALGGNGLYNNTTGNNNTAVGRNSLYNNTTGLGNIGFGGQTSAGTYSPVFDPTTENDRIVMGSTSVTNAYVQVAWTVTSDARDKTNFAPVPYGLDFVKQLQPTAYQFKAGSRNLRDQETKELIPPTPEDELPSGPVRYGFKAQDILALEGDNPVIIDNEDPDHLRYRGEALVPVLVNAIKEQQVLIDALTARLDAAGL